MKALHTLFAASLSAALLVACGGRERLSTNSVGGLLPHDLPYSPAAKTSCLQSACIYVTCSYKLVSRIRVAIFPVDANGDVSPIEQISGDKTRLEGPQGISVDSNHIVRVVNGTAITAYAAGAYGNMAPDQVISGNHTGLYFPQQLALDQSGNIYVANSAYGGSKPPSITVYAAGANGNVFPIRIIKGSKAQLKDPWGIVVWNGRIYVTNLTGGPSGLGSLNIYRADATGNVAPLYTITGHFTSLAGPTAVATDASGKIYVANGAGRLTVYDARAKGDGAPIRIITGRNTRLRAPRGIALDSTGTIFVANGTASISHVTVYSAGSNGNVKPIRNIEGPNTKLNGCTAYGIAVR